MYMYMCIYLQNYSAKGQYWGVIQIVFAEKVVSASVRLADKQEVPLYCVKWVRLLRSQVWGFLFS